MSYKNLALLLSLFTLLCSCNSNSDLSIIKEDFQEYDSAQDLGNWKKEGKGIFTIDSSKAGKNNKSLKLVSGEGYSNRAFISMKQFLPKKTTSYKGSMKMFVEKASPDGVHWTMIETSGTVPETNVHAELRYGGQHHQKLMANYDTKPKKSDCWHHSEIKIPENKWFDISWSFDQLKNESKFWLNGVLIEDLTVNGQGQGCLSNEMNGKWLFPKLEKLSLGWVDYQNGGGSREVWIDDIVITTL